MQSARITTPMTDKLFCKKCELCRNDLTGQLMPMVPGTGPVPADIMIVGMNPGRQEQQRLIPFIGRAGSVLDRALQEAGINRESCYLTTAVKHALPSTRKKLRKPEIEACRPFLDIELRAVKPKVIVALGGDAIGLFTGNNKVMDQRGRPLPLGEEFGNAILMPTFHPANFLYKESEPTELVIDLKMAAELARGAQGLEYTEAIVIQKLEDFVPLMAEMAQTGEVAFDIETTGLCHECEKITDIVFCATPGRAYVVPLQYLRGEHWEKFSGSEVLERALDIIRNPDIAKITHGGCFDYRFLFGQGLITFEEMASWAYDTQYGHHALLDEHGPFYLETMAANATSLAAWDQEKRRIEQIHGRGAVWTMGVQDRAAYAAGDADATLQLAQTQRPAAVERWGDLDFYDQIVRPALPVLTEIMSHGFKVDIDQLNDIRRLYRRQLRALDQQILSILRITDPKSPELLEELEIKSENEFNPNSDSQMVRAIESRTKIRWPRDHGWFMTDKGDRPSSRKEVRNAMAENHPHPIWHVWRDRKRLAKMLSQYVTAPETLYQTHSTSERPKSITAKLCPVTGKCYTSLAPQGTRTGRRASRDPNLQNAPKRDDEDSEVQASLVRTVFVPSFPDWKLVACDFDAAEVWVAAHLSGDPELLRIIDEDLDMHSMTAARVFGYSFEDFTALIAEGKELARMGKKLPADLALADAQRTKAKVVNFGGILYGGGARKISRDIDVSEREAQQILNEVEKIYERFYEWRREQVELIKSRGYVETAYGRRRNLQWPSDEKQQGHVEREAFNSPIQGTVADHMLRAMVRVRAALQNTCQGGIVLELHDELISEVPADQSETWLQNKIDAMTFDVPAFGKPLPVSGEIRDRWKVIE